MLKRQGPQERRALRLLNHSVCQRSFRLLLGLGKRRFQRLRNAVINDEQECPIDQRFSPRAYSRFPDDGVRPAIVQFLRTLYHTTAEPLPEAVSSQTGSGNHPGQDEGSRVKLGPQNLVRRRGKRPRHFCKYDSAEERGHISTAKFLPPGTILDYLELCRTENPSLKIGRKVFTRVPWLYRVGRQPNFGRHPASRTGFHVAIFV